MTAPQPLTTLPTGVVTFLLTDVADSTPMWERSPDVMTGVMARHYEILHAAVTDHGGALPVEQGEGDSIVAAFRAGSDAVAAALAAQRSLAAEPWPDDVDVAVRMALHTGEAKLRDLGNYAGETIIRTARLRALAHGGQVIASRQCVDLVGDTLPAGADWLDLGAYRLKGLGRPEPVLQLLHPDLGAEFPPLRGPDSVTNNLPTQLTPFIGREAELAQLHALLDDTRLLTVTGSGGCGKTRLALEAATDRIERHADGIWYVELAPLGETSSVVDALAAVLNVRGSAGESLLDAVVTRLADQHTLVVIDNCEHLLDECTVLVEALLRGCPPLQIMTTSRQPLNLPGEVTWRVPSLGSPKADVAVTVDIAHPVRRGATVRRPRRTRPPELHRRQRQRPVRRDDLWATRRHSSRHRAGGRACAQRVGRPDRRGPRRPVPAAARRQQHAPSPPADARTSRSSGATSCSTRTSSVLLRRLARFSGGFDLDAAEAVCSFDPLDEFAVLDLLGNLVDRSLVVLDDEGPADRYRLLESIKQFARARLDESGENDAVLDRHLTHFAGVARRLAPDLETGAQRDARPVLAREAENLRVALEHAADRDDPERLATVAFDLVLFWLQTAGFTQGDHWLELAASGLAGSDSATLARVLWGSRLRELLLRQLRRGLRHGDRGTGGRRARRRPSRRPRAASTCRPTSCS